MHEFENNMQQHEQQTIGNKQARAHKHERQTRVQRNRNSIHRYETTKGCFKQHAHKCKKANITCKT